MVERDGNSNLLIPTAIIGRDYKLVRPFAEQQVQFINGVGRLLSPGFRPVALTDQMFGLNAEGKVVHTVVAVGTAEMRVKAGAIRAQIGKRTLPDPRKGAATPFFKAVSRPSKARDALALIGRGNLTWSDLYLAFELVEAEEGGRMYSAGWVSKAQAKGFTHTANSYMTLGLAGRHGKDTRTPPASPMKREDAETMVRNLVRQWLEYLGTRAP